LEILKQDESSYVILGQDSGGVKRVLKFVPQSSTEVQMVKMLHNQYIVPLLQVFNYGNEAIMLFPCRNPFQTPHTMDDVLQSSLQLFLALDYLHNLEIAHLDIAPRNLLSNNGMLQLCDFGISQRFTSSPYPRMKADEFHAPEMGEGTAKNGSPDIWAAGRLVGCWILSAACPYTFHLFVKDPNNLPEEIKKNGILFQLCKLAINAKQQIPSHRVTTTQAIENLRMCITMQEQTFST